MKVGDVQEAGSSLPVIDERSLNRRLDVRDATFVDVAYVRRAGETLRIQLLKMSVQEDGDPAFFTGRTVHQHQLGWSIARFSCGHVGASLGFQVRRAPRSSRTTKTIGNNRAKKARLAPPGARVGTGSMVCANARNAASRRWPTACARECPHSRGEFVSSDAALAGVFVRPG